MENKLKILGISGSLRKGSFNTSLLLAAQEVCANGAEVTIADIGGIPIFNQMLEAIPPKAVMLFKEQIEHADAILFATPEYNYSIPGVLKNAIDWASRPYGNNSWNDKPVGIMSAAGGMLGGSRAQYHLRQSFVFLNMHPVNKPEVIVPFAQEKVVNGLLIDEFTKGKIKELLDALILWTKRIKE